jgi:murein L,D-transpeptidase YcbB/YkuD
MNYTNFSGSSAGSRNIFGGALLLLVLASTAVAAPRTIEVGPALSAEIALRAAPQPNKSGRPLPAQQLLQRFYEPGGYAPVWTVPGFKQARSALTLLAGAESHGLSPANYKVDAISAQLDALTTASAADFEIGLSTAVLQYLADLHFGRVKSYYAGSPVSTRLPEYDPVERLRAALKENNVAELANGAEPQLPLYKRVRSTLAQYRTLAQSAPEWPQLTPLKKGVKVVAGDRYEEAPLLRARLQLLGDLSATPVAPVVPVAPPAPAAPAAKTASAASAATTTVAPAIPEDQLYSPALSDGVKQFQSRHGLEEDGTLGPATMKALAFTPAQRVRQLEMSLERLRWLPVQRPGRTIFVNLPAFRLWAYDSASATPAEPLEMRVIVGALKTQTPLFIGQLRYLEFNPFWNVPRSIELGEIIPKINADPQYLEKNDMEIVSTTGVALDGDGMAELRAAKARVRQRPGEQNALGAVKFSMPNKDNIYLHSTSTPKLFAKAKRDLSHGCIRVEQPAELAAFVLGDQTQWNAAAIEAAMQPGKSKTVNLKQVIPVVLFYTTAATDARGRALFAEDIYKLDPKLDSALQAASKI